MGGVDVGSGPEVLTGTVHELDLGARLDVETLRDESAIASKGDSRRVWVDLLVEHLEAEPRWQAADQPDLPGFGLRPRHSGRRRLTSVSTH